MSDLPRLMRRLRALPPGVMLRRAWERVSRSIILRLRRLQARYLPTATSPAGFARALRSDSASPVDFLGHWQSRTSPRFFFGSADREHIVAALHTLDPSAEVRILATADAACAHRFDLLGSSPTGLGPDIDWHTDFKSGYRWNPDTFYADLEFHDLDQHYDVKVPWELSRCQHFVALGQAYWFTEDERYPQEFVAQLNSWLDANPPQFGVNWACTMEVAIRAVNWLWGYYLCQDSPALTNEFRLRLICSLLDHGRYIVGNLERTATLTSNHYLSDLAGLAFLALTFPELREATHWKQIALDGLWEEMEKQVYSDGVDFEASTAYHRLVTELFLVPILLCQANSIPVPDRIMERLEQMFEVVLYLTRSDGTMPVIGDADDGRLLKLSWHTGPHAFTDMRYLLAIGATLFERADFAAAAGDRWEDALWLLGPAVLDTRARLNAQPTSLLTSHAFPKGGLYVMRHDDMHLVIDAGPNGQNGNGGHAHNDILSFELFAGRPWIVDPGSYVYTADYRERNRFRSTAYHNTVVVDGEEMNRFAERLLFTMREDAVPSVLRWESNEQWDLLEGEHSGYQRLPAPVIHRRRILFDKNLDFWLIEDNLLGEGTHNYTLYLHFAPCELERHDGGRLRLTANGDEFWVVLLAHPAGLHLTLERGWVSSSYGTRISAPVARYSSSGPIPSRLVMLLTPRRGPGWALETIVREATANLTLGRS